MMGPTRATESGLRWTAPENVPQSGTQLGDGAGVGAPGRRTLQGYASLEALWSLGGERAR